MPDTSDKIIKNIEEIEVQEKDLSFWEFFKAGWRPMLGWVSVFIIFYSFVIHPSLVWYTAFAYPDVKSPALDAYALLNLVAIVIGVGAMRSFDKNNKYNVYKELNEKKLNSQNQEDI